jgi:lipopolysaccharide/colanic/teichoic acid biosynthesis glycosyltransferase
VLELVAFRLAPAAAAGGIAFAHMHSEWQGVLMVVCVLGAVKLLRRPRFPLHLMPVASIAVYLLAPVLGAAAAAAISAFSHSITPLTAADLVAPVLGAWTVTAVGASLARAFRRDREVRVGVIGSHDFMRGLEAELEAVGVRGYRVIGCINPDRRGWPRSPEPSEPFLGSIRSLRQVVLEHRLELLVVGPLTSVSGQAHVQFQAAGPTRPDLFEIVADACLDLPVSMIEAVQLYEQLFGHVPLGTTNSSWFQYLLHPAQRGAWPVSKRVLDLVVGAVASLVAAPILLISAIAIKLGDGGPVFYRQTRIGANGREFELLKLRTMRSDADGRRAEGLCDDDLVTPVGRVLCRLHFNELPQLWLVLKGEMSLVGPRPELPEIVASLESRFIYYDRRHLLKPGITGWASVRCGYSGTPIGESWKLCHDLYYLKRRSLLFDLLILIETLSSVIVPEPANRPDERFIVAAAPGEELRPTAEAA